VLCGRCRTNDLPFIPFRFWIGFWVMVALLVIVAFELSFLVRYITRFTEECFACLVSLIFIYEAFHKLADITTTQPIHTGVTREDPDELFCHCVPVFNSSSSGIGVTVSPESIFQLASVTVRLLFALLARLASLPVLSSHPQHRKGKGTYT